MKKIKKIDRNLKRLFCCTILTVLCGVSAGLAKPDAESVFLAAAGNERKIPVYSVETDEKKVAVTFDAAWGADDTDELLRILDEYDAKATFFLCGFWVEKYPDKVRKIFAGGHDIGNHGDTHAHSGKLSFEENKAEIKGAHDKVKELVGVEMNLYRPPYGEYNDVVLEAAENLGYYSIQWDVETLHTKAKPTQLHEQVLTFTL